MSETALPKAAAGGSAARLRSLRASPAGTGRARQSGCRQDVATVFDCLVEVAAPTPESPSWILWKYPEDFADEAKLKAVCEFAYPAGPFLSRPFPAPLLPASTRGAAGRRSRRAPSRCSPSSSRAPPPTTHSATPGTRPGPTPASSSYRNTLSCPPPLPQNRSATLERGLSWTNFFYKLLNHFASVMNNDTVWEANRSPHFHYCVLTCVHCQVSVQ